MVIAGIDEAGYGPILGPLVVSCCAFEAPAEGQEPPCLWSILRRVVARHRDRTGRKLQINDSKLVYSPAGGLKQLERSVLAVAWVCGMSVSSLEDLCVALDGQSLPFLKEHPWYVQADAERFPLEQEAAAIRVMSNALRAEMQRTRTSCVHLAARILPEIQLNRLLDTTRNKSSVVFSMVAWHLDRLLTGLSDRQLVVVCDRQGGRQRYGRLLRLMFGDWSLEILAERPAASEYRLRRNGRAAQLIFREKAETSCLPVALASMFSKYMREALMRRFNAYWQRQIPGLKPTAGYYSDGCRFLSDIDRKMRELGIAPAQLVRRR